MRFASPIAPSRPSRALVPAASALLALVLASCSGSSTAVDASLSGLAVSAGHLNPVFNSGTTGYSLTVPNGTLSVAVTPTASDSAAQSITVAQDNGTATTVASGSASPTLAVPARDVQSLIVIVVTGHDGTTTETYTVELVQADNADTALSALVLSAGTLSPAFAPGTFSYTALVPAATTGFKITPTADYANIASITTSQDGATAKVVASGSASSSFTLPAAGATSNIAIVVTAQNGYTTQAYTLALRTN